MATTVCTLDNTGKNVNLNNNFKVGPRHWGGVKVANSAITGNNPYS